MIEGFLAAGRIRQSPTTTRFQQTPGCEVQSHLFIILCPAISNLRADVEGRAQRAGVVSSRGRGAVLHVPAPRCEASMCTCSTARQPGSSGCCIIRQGSTTWRLGQAAAVQPQPAYCPSVWSSAALEATGRPPHTPPRCLPHHPQPSLQRQAPSMCMLPLFTHHQAT